MIHFKTAKEIFGIDNEEEFAESEFRGVEHLLGKRSYINCLFAVSSEEAEDTQELYYFLEANGETIKWEDNFQLVEMDGLKFVIIDNNSSYTIVIGHQDKQHAEELI